MFNNTRFNIGAGLPPVTKNLIIVNFLLWLVALFIPGFGNTLENILGLHYFESGNFNPAQLVTYMFLHGGFTHLFFNMFSLWMFGKHLESIWGSKRFALFYFVCGIGAAFIQELVWYFTLESEYVALLANQISETNGITVGQLKTEIWQQIQSMDSQRLADVQRYAGMLCTIGASGAIFGILLGFAFVFPNLPLYLMFIPVPIKAKYFVMGYAIIELMFGINGTMDSVAHFAHLGGMLFGLIILLYWHKKGTLRGGLF